MKKIIILSLVLLMSGCAAFKPVTPKTLAEKFTSYSYIPFDPLPVQTLLGGSCTLDNAEKEIRSIDKVKIRPLRNSFPDQTVRLAVAEFQADGSLTFGPATVGFEGQTYQVIIDYMNTDTTRGSFLVKRTVTGQTTQSNIFGFSTVYKDYKKGRVVGLFEEVPSGVITSYDVKPNLKSTLFSDKEIMCNNINNELINVQNGEYDIINLPVYVGVGLRLTATIRVLKGTVNLSGLPQIAAEAQAGKLSGTLVVQTLGATGELVSANLPLPNELNRTTVQTSIQALGAIKALLPDKKMKITPRVIGIYNPIGGGQSFVNGVISALSSKRLSWYQPCDYSYKN